MKNFQSVVAKDNPQFTPKELLLQAYTHADYWCLRVILLGRKSFLPCDISPEDTHKLHAIILVED